MAFIPIKNGSFKITGNKNNKSRQSVDMVSAASLTQTVTPS